MTKFRTDKISVISIVHLRNTKQFLQETVITDPNNSGYVL